MSLTDNQLAEIERYLGWMRNGHAVPLAGVGHFEKLLAEVRLLRAELNAKDIRLADVEQDRDSYRVKLGVASDDLVAAGEIIAQLRANKCGCGRGRTEPQCPVCDNDD